MTTGRALSISYLGQVDTVGRAQSLLKAPGDTVIVHRETDRSLVMLCPSGCGEKIVINLDPRSGPAWRLYRRQNRLTLYPSVWRETGCKSHFIIWRDKIHWCNYDEEWDDSSVDIELEQRILQSLAPGLAVHFWELAEALDEIPWSVWLSCRKLSGEGRLNELTGKKRGFFFVGRPK